MKKRYGRRITAIIAAVLVTLAFMPLLPTGMGAVYADDIPPAADETITVDWSGTLVIDQNRTVKISGINHDNTGTDAGAPIKITNGATVNLVFEGENILVANPSKTCAGIEVENGAAVNIYGLDGSRLEVTGGNTSAGIGGIGYGNGENPPCGIINIYSGKITATGGNRGAGIGSGNHSSVSEINIYGGDITAIGTSWAAGIGSGYGTSGGAHNPGVGFYQGGNITIKGGTVRAAVCPVDFDNLDPYDPNTLRGEGFTNSCAAGIGGGYGASSGNIVIEGNADVIAIGGCGGAGIGTGRGVTKDSQYDPDHAFCNVTIRGNAKVVAIATKDSRSGYEHKNASGAAIGLGRYWCSHDYETGTTDPLGSVVIDGNANVYAYAESGANGIGTGVEVKFLDAGFLDGVTESNAHLENLYIGPETTVVAVSDIACLKRTAFDEKFAVADIPASALNLSEEFLRTAHVGSESAFFTEDKFPTKAEVRIPGKREALTTFPITKNGTGQVGIHLPSGYASKAYYKIRDYEAANGSGVLLALSEKDNGWKFGNGEHDVTNLLYEKYKIKYNLNGGTNASANPATYNVYGPAVTLAAPTRSGYTFEGWFGNEKLTGSAVRSIPAGSVGDKTVWAKWTKNAEPAYGVILAELTAKGKTSLVMSWNKVSGAEGYDVFFIKCSKIGGDAGKAKRVKTIKGNKTTKWTKKGLKKKTAYRGYVKAWVKKDGKKTYVSTSPMVHAYTSGGNKNYTNAKSVTVEKASVSLKVKKTYKIKATVTKLKESKDFMPTSHAATLRYLSSNTKIATVNKSGKIKGKAKGTCYIYVYTVNGISKKVKVTVK